MEIFIRRSRWIDKTGFKALPRHCPGTPGRSSRSRCSPASRFARARRRRRRTGTPTHTRASPCVPRGPLEECRRRRCVAGPRLRETNHREATIAARRCHGILTLSTRLLTSIKHSRRRRRRKIGLRRSMGQGMRASWMWRKESVICANR